MTAVVPYPTKKVLKSKIGQEIEFIDTSIFGSEYPPKGTGRAFVVGPSAHERKYYAQIHLHEHKLVNVK